MRVLIFHGYLLRGTGSNVYNASLAAALARLGHEVELVCQERDPATLAALPDGVTVHNPEIGRLLPVYVLDAYDGFDAKEFLECSDEELETYLAANVATVREVAERVRPDVALANHLVMGPVVLARAFGTTVPYAVKVHGSDLEYVVKRDLARFGPYAHEGLAPARAALVGSRHTAESLWEAMDDPALPSRTRLGPPGVDVVRFAPRERVDAVRRTASLAAGLEASREAPGVGSFARDAVAAGRALAQLRPDRDRFVLYVGKLIVSKGVDLLLAAWPLVRAQSPDAHLVVVGFGGYREGLERLLAALSAGDLLAAQAVASAGRALEGGPARPLPILAGFLDRMSGPDGHAYRAAVAGIAASVTIVGRLDHEELADLLPLCEAQVVPSTFPEAFGMVAAEAAACGTLPVSAAHSGLAEVTRTLREAVPAQIAPLLSFELGPNAVEELADRLVRWLAAPAAARERTRAALVSTARERYSWEGVARGVVAGAQGRLDDLVPPA